MVWRVGSAVRSIFSPKKLGFISITYTDTNNICNSIPRASPSLSNLSIHRALTLYMRMHAEKAVYIQNDKNLDVQRFIYFTILCVCLQMSVCTYVCVYRYALLYMYFKARRGHGKPFFYHSLTIPLSQHLSLNLGLSFSQLSYKPASPSAPPSLWRDEIIGIYKTHSS